MPCVHFAERPNLQVARATRLSDCSTGVQWGDYAGGSTHCELRGWSISREASFFYSKIISLSMDFVAAVAPAFFMHDCVVFRAFSLQSHCCGLLLPSGGLECPSTWSDCLFARSSTAATLHGRRPVLQRGLNSAASTTVLFGGSTNGSERRVGARSAW